MEVVVGRPGSTDAACARNIPQRSSRAWPCAARSAAMCLLAAAALAAVCAAALAQAEGLTLGIGKTWGYTWRGEMQGLFTLSVNGPPDLQAVTFLLDGAPLTEVTAPPFSTQFTTDDYALGAHVLGATGVTGGGDILRADDIGVSFVEADRGLQMTLRVAGPIVGLVVAFMVVVTVVAVVGNRRQPSRSAPQHYGLLGGAICPRCGRAFALRALSLNLVTRRLDRCPHCGKWSLVRTASPADLRAGEAAFDEAVAEAPDLSSEDYLRRAVEESRYVDE